MSRHSTGQMVAIISQLFLNRPKGTMELRFHCSEGHVLDAIMNEDGEDPDCNQFPVDEINAELKDLDTPLVIEDVAFSDYYLIRKIEQSPLRHTVTLLDVEAAIEELKI